MIVQHKTTLGWNYIMTSEIASKYDVVEYVPKALNLIDCNDFTKKELVNRADQINATGMGNVNASTFAKIQALQNEYFNATHPESIISDQERQKIKNSYLKLKNYIEAFIGTELTRSSSGDAQLFGFRLGESNLSDGQKVLLQFCVAIYSQATNLKDLILFMDEPENHLHPSVLIEVINRLQEHVSNGQIWIATHSIPLLAHFDPATIWYVEDGKVSYAGRETEKVLEGLLGDDEERAKIHDFLSLPSIFAANKFAYECLLPPQTVMTPPDDPQMLQMQEIIHKVKARNEKLRVLDFGAGKGRLPFALYDADEVNKLDLKNWLEYVAFDIDEKDAEHCINAVERIYEKNDDRYFNNANSLLSKYENDKFDLVVMCNVFHEIDPSKWLSIFSSNGMLSRLLNEDGYLLVVEDQLIPIGEKAFPNGFIMFNTPQFQIFFRLQNQGEIKKFDARSDGRLIGYLIPKKGLDNVNQESCVGALESLHCEAKSKIRELRQEEASSKTGRLFALWLQQFANSQLTLEELFKGRVSV